MYRRKTLAASCTLYPSQSRPFPHAGGELKRDCSSLILLADPLTRKIPSTSVATGSAAIATSYPSLSNKHRTLPQ
jgi:hypothetical protein